MLYVKLSTHIYLSENQIFNFIFFDKKALRVCYFKLSKVLLTYKGVSIFCPNKSGEKSDGTAFVKKSVSKEI